MAQQAEMTVAKCSQMDRVHNECTLSINITFHPCGECILSTEITFHPCGECVLSRSDEWIIKKEGPLTCYPEVICFLQTASPVERLPAPLPKLHKALPANMTIVARLMDVLVPIISNQFTLITLPLG